MAMHHPELNSGPIIDLEVVLKESGKRNPLCWQSVDQNISLPNLPGKRDGLRKWIYIWNIFRELYEVIWEDW